MIIEPTIGRVVLLWPNTIAQGVHYHFGHPFAAIIVYVWDSRLINVSYFDHRGDHWSANSVVLVQEGDAKPDDKPFATWMPYQLGQAKAHAPT